MSNIYYQYTVHCSVVFANPFRNNGVAQDDIDENLNELEDEIREKLEFNYQIENLELYEFDVNNLDDTPTSEKITCSFDFQGSFTQAEIEQDSEGGEEDFSPTDEALSALEVEFKPLFSEYNPISFEFYADFDDFMSDIEEDED
jgi:hypothetical protein